MIRAKIKSFEITEVADIDPAKYVPEDFDDFSCTFGLKIGPSDSEGDELFYLTVCSPKALVRAAEQDGFLVGSSSSHRAGIQPDGDHDNHDQVCRELLGRIMVGSRREVEPVCSLGV